MKKHIVKGLIGILLSTSALCAMEEGREDRALMTTGLSLEGRGMEALIPAVVLREMECYTQLPVYELFDVAGGTSAGALIALKAFSPRPLGMHTLVEDFKRDGPAVFTPDSSRYFKYIKSQYYNHTVGAVVSTASGMAPGAATALLKQKGIRDAAFKEIENQQSSLLENMIPSIEAMTKNSPLPPSIWGKDPDHPYNFVRKLTNDGDVFRERMGELTEIKTNQVQKLQHDYDAQHGIGVQEVGKNALIGMAIAFCLHTTWFGWKMRGDIKKGAVPAYTQENLEVFLNNMLRGVGLRKLLKPVLIPVSKKDGTVFLFNSSQAYRQKGLNFDLADVAKSTMAHPSDFLSQEVRNLNNTTKYTFYDGGLQINNAAADVYRRLKKIQFNPAQTFLLSLGIADIEGPCPYPLSPWDIYDFPTAVDPSRLPGTESTFHHLLSQEMGANYVRKQAEFILPRSKIAVCEEALAEFEQKGIDIAKELEDAGIFRMLAENRSRKHTSELSVDDEVNAFEELTGINLRKSPDHEKEQETPLKEDQSWREKEPEKETKKDI